MPDKHPKLKILSTEERGKVIPLTKERITCGRAETNDFILNDGSVSSNHCTFIQNELGYVIKDEDSTNGTFVNNLKIKTRPLKDEDILSIGNVELLYDSGYLKQIKNDSSSAKVAFNLEADNSNMPLADMQNFSPFANKRNSRAAIMKKIMFFSCIGLVIAAVALLGWILLSSM